MTEGVNATVEVVFRLLEGMLGRDVVVWVFTANDSALCKLECGGFGVLTLMYGISSPSPSPRALALRHFQIIVYYVQL